MTKPIALQLYTLRDALGKDFEGVIRKVAEIGYAGVETANMYGKSPADAAKLFQELGLQVASAHAPLPLGGKKNEVLDTIATLGCKRLICAFFPPEEFTSTDKVKHVCDQLNEADAVAQENGLTFFYHNHWWEFEYLVEGKPAYQFMLDHLNPTVHFEVDTYWVQVGGLDPVAAVSELGARASLLHIKDGPATKDDPMTAVGTGVLDWAAVIGAGSAADWLIVELDRCATDMLEAVSKSYDYLITKGFAHGSKG